jgi:valyl-tRNA synthetase
MLDKTYRPADFETRLYDTWERTGGFAVRPGSGTPYCVMMPPPNVTGSLHMGHALNNTLQDVLTRYRRKTGRDALWQPGMDHAGIATQMVVERQLAEQQIDRRDMGREAFVERVWSWKAESGGAIAHQLRRLGASPDWSRDRFTMDEGLSKAVVQVFVTLYRQGLIYRDKRLVNWDPKLLTAISDLEVEQREVKDGNLWYFRYPLEKRPGEHIVVATTRPETMLGDTAIAVHPEDERYRDLVGSHALLPLVGRRLKIVADEHADPSQGSGAVKITPAHDFNDFEVGKRHDLEMVNVFDEHARLNENAPEAYRGLDRFEARERVVADLEAQEFLEKIEAHAHVVPMGDRSGAVIEPWLTDQWYVDAATLAKPAIEVVETGRIRFVPQRWENTYFEWMRNIQPWCISRQLWWGHQIPAWYGPDGHVFVGATEAEAQEEADRHYGEAATLTRDPDVLDTWFSSGLWPFSTLGWPERTEALETYYPNDDMITGFDIIFFWVARMVMLGIHFMDDIPFRTVYIHALVRDEKGQKMSKSKGNVIDPLALMDKYGADALRFTLAAMEAQGRDIKLAESRVEGYRNFATKLWNAARFCEANACHPDPKFDPAGCQDRTNRWIVGEAARASEAVTKALEAYRFNEAANAVYQFTWGVFCDWYLEFSKPTLMGADGPDKQETRATAAWVLDLILGLLHPFMPFITEELWGRLAEERPSALITAPWPAPGAAIADAEADAEMDWVLRLISDIRAVRAEMNVPAGAKIALGLQGAWPETLARLQRHHGVITRLARLSEAAALADGVPSGSVQTVLDEATVVLPLAGVIEFDKEQARLEKEIGKLGQEMTKLEKKLGNKQFLERAPEHVVEEQRGRLDETRASRERLEAALSRIAAL